MSQIKLKHSGGNSVIIAAPDSNPASDRTLKLPSDGDGTILTSNSSVGKILQAVQTYSTAIYSTSSNSMTEYAALNTTITPSSSSNKILIMVSLSVGASNTAGQGFQLYDGSTHISAATNTNVSNNSAMTVQIDSQYDVKQPAMQFLYSPSTTSATTIKVYVEADSGTTLYINRYGYGAFRGGGSSMTLMEVAV